MKLQAIDRAITVKGSNVHLGDGLPDHARASITRVASKYFGRLNAASVHFGREGSAYRCTVDMQIGGLPTKSAEASDQDIYVAFSAALDKDVYIHTHSRPAMVKAGFGLGTVRTEGRSPGRGSGSTQPPTSGED